MNDDYLEMPLYGEDYDDDWQGATLLVYMKDNSIIGLHGVKYNPVRYQGWWTIDHDLYGQRQTAKIPAENVQYFSINDHVKVTKNVTLED